MKGETYSFDRWGFPVIVHNLPFDVRLGMQARIRLLDVLVEVVEGLRLEAPLLVADGRDLDAAGQVLGHDQNVLFRDVHERGFLAGEQVAPDVQLLDDGGSVGWEILR